MKAKLLMVGECPNCHASFIRPLSCTAASCMCSNPGDATLVPLHLVLELPNQLYHKLKKIADYAGIPLDRFVSALLLEAGKEKLRNLRAREICVSRVTCHMKR